MIHPYKLSKDTEKQLEELFEEEGKVFSEDHFRHIQNFAHHALMPHYDRVPSSLKNQDALDHFIQAFKALGEFDQTFLIGQFLFLNIEGGGKIERIDQSLGTLFLEAAESCILEESEDVPATFQKTIDFLSCNQGRLLTALGFDPANDALYKKLSKVLLADPIFEKVKIAAFDEWEKGDALFEKTMPEVMQGVFRMMAQSKGGNNRAERYRQMYAEIKQEIYDYLSKNLHISFTKALENICAKREGHPSESAVKKNIRKKDVVTEELAEKMKKARAG